MINLNHIFLACKDFTLGDTYTADHELDTNCPRCRAERERRDDVRDRWGF